VRSARLSLPVVVGVVALAAIGLARSEEIRERALAGLGAGVPAREAALSRGFVLGADEEVDPQTEEDFRRSGLAHLLAVSGQNVTLLALLAMPLLAAFGIPLRERLLWILGLIAVYVPLAGAGPSIQRAAVMGAAGLLAMLAGRPASRLFALAAALIVTLAFDPGVAADVGWQLSFAAVAGIFVLATPIRRAISARFGASGWRRALAEGVAVTVAATLATAPLIAFHFGALSLTTLLANVLAMPAVAPAMWLGMASAAAAQVPGLPVEVLNLPNAFLLAYIAEVAAWCGRPEWAEADVSLGGTGLVVSYLVLAALSAAVLRFGSRLVLWGVSAAALLPGLVLLAPLALRGGDAPPVVRGLRVSVLDVGQGDAILLQPVAAPAVLVDGGPTAAGLAAELEEAGVERLGAAVITHDQADHAGGIEELLGHLPVPRLVYARLSAETLALAREAGAVPVRVGAGDVLRSGALRLEVLSPPGAPAGSPTGEDANRLSLVLLARWRSFSMLLTGDAEAEAVPLEPGPVDVLKLAHHGSEDAGLAALLERTRPALAVVSVGRDNSYGHPAPATLAALARAGIRTLRTDRDGEIVIEAGRHSIAATASG